MNALKDKLLQISTAILVVAGSTATANSDKVGANARLAFSDKISMYSQRIVGSACALTLSDAPYEGRGYLAVAGHEINRILNALENGDLALGIPTVEENDNILEILADMRAEWDQASLFAMSFLDDRSEESKLAELAQHNKTISKSSARLVAAITNQYTDTDSLLLTDAVRLQVAGRQRMLSQKISFEACLLQKSSDSTVRSDLSNTIEMFELSAAALRQGMPEVGVVATTDPAMLAGLDKVDRLWSELKWPLLALQSGTPWDNVTSKRLYLQLNELMHEMDKVVVSYTKAANAARG